MPRKKDSKQKARILFVEEKNDFASQMAEYFARQMYDGLYDVYSAGPEHDIVDCEMIAAMYDSGEDLRRQVSKDLKDRDYLREDEDYDIVVYMDRATYESLSGKSPWQGRQMLAEVCSRSDFTATDDLELYHEYLRCMGEMREWVRENLADPEALKARLA